MPDLTTSVIDRIVETLERDDGPSPRSYFIQSPGAVQDRVTGANRAVDAVISDGREKVIVEVWDGPADVQLIEAVATKLFDVDADRAIIVVNGASSDDVRKKADHHGVLVLTAEEATTGDWVEWLATCVPRRFALRVGFNHVRFIFSGAVPLAHEAVGITIGTGVFSVHRPFLESPGAPGCLRIWTVSRLLFRGVAEDKLKREVLRRGSIYKRKIRVRLDPPLRYTDNCSTDPGCRGYSVVALDMNIDLSVDRAGRPQQGRLRNRQGRLDPDLATFDFAGTSDDDLEGAILVNVREQSFSLHCKDWEEDDDLLP